MMLIDDKNSLTLNTNGLDLISKILETAKPSNKHKNFPGLVIDWEPFFNIFISHYFCGKRQSNMSNYGDHCSALLEAVEAGRLFFAPGSTVKILERIRPLFSFVSTSAYK